MFDFPDSEIARKATRLVAETSPQFLYHHAIRAFLFGDALGRRDGLKYDRELLYLGAIMHDLGLNDRFFGEQRFEVEGADVAHRFAIENKLSDEKAEIIWDAIALHTTVGVALRKRPEIALVCLGTSADTGGRLTHLFRQQVGLSFGRYVLGLRLKAALQGLSSGATLTDVAYRAGFADAAHLSRTARLILGRTPTSLRAHSWSITHARSKTRELSVLL